MCAGGEVGRLLLRGPVATGILDPYAPAVALSADKPSPRKRFPLLKIYELTLNGVVKGDAASTHISWFCHDAWIEKLPCKNNRKYFVFLPYITRLCQIARKRFTLPNITLITFAIIFTLEESEERYGRYKYLKHC